MNHRRTVSLVFATFAAIALVMSGAGFGAVSVERGVKVAVVNDSEAFIGYQSDDIEAVESNTEIRLVTVTNRFESPISVTDVTVDSQSSDVEIVDPTTPENIAPGESAEIAGRMDLCTFGSS